MGTTCLHFRPRWRRLVASRGSRGGVTSMQICRREGARCSSCRRAAHSGWPYLHDLRCSFLKHRLKGAAALARPHLGAWGTADLSSLPRLCLTKGTAVVALCSVLHCIISQTEFMGGGLGLRNKPRTYDGGVQLWIRESRTAKARWRCQ